ncbi:hypothetical protein F4604DRAFT_1813034 [Suillus subluteus]|nr:hypothetical protein F4604DRAFT_1813034 [Suillus subluteus]
MKFISPATIIMSAAVLVGIVIAQDPTGGSCNQRVFAGKHECGRSAGYNGGHAYLYLCSTDNFVTEVKDCSCIECCSVASDGTTQCT